jgi:hypothetical protein
MLCSGNCRLKLNSGYFLFLMPLLHRVYLSKFNGFPLIHKGVDKFYSFPYEWKFSMKYHIILMVIGLGIVPQAFPQEAPTGTSAEISPSEQKALSELAGKVIGKIVWSTSRSHSKHDIWIMNADGSEQKKLTSSPDNVDWFPRFSPDGLKVLFTRSKAGKYS